MMNDLSIDVLRDRFVKPFYLRLLHGNFAYEQSAVFLAQLRDAAVAISDAQIARLLAEREWRGRLSTAWLVGLSRRENFVDQIAQLLLASELVYAGQGYCMALCLIGNETCSRHLHEYLTKYLPLNGRWYNQTWALAACALLEPGAESQYLEPSLWTDHNGCQDPRGGLTQFRHIIDYMQRQKLIPGADLHLKT